MKLENIQSRDSKRQGGKLNNWYKFACCPDGSDFVIKGQVSGDDKWDEGEYLTTSLVMRVNENDNTIETLNTIYTLGNKHPEHTERWNKSVQSLVPWVELDIPEFKIDLEYCTGVPVVLSYKKHMQVNTTIEEAPWCGSYSTVDHPSFTALRNHLAAWKLIDKEDGWVNGDRVLQEFKLNGILSSVGESFPCASAMKYKLEEE